MSWSRRAVRALLLLSLTVTATGAAQGVRAQLGVATGRTIPIGDYHAAASGEGFTSAWQGMAFVALQVHGWPLGFRVDGTYCKNGANDQLKADLTTRLGQPTDEKTKLFGGNLDLTYAFRSPSRVKPYLLGGVGMYHVTIAVTSGSVTTKNAATKFAWNLGGGTSYRLGGVAVFLEVRYINVAAVSGFHRTTFLPIAVGIRSGGR